MFQDGSKSLTQALHGVSTDHTFTPCSSNLEVEAIDAQVAQYLGLVQELRYRRNALMPISRLPPEILCSIFLHVQTMGKESQGNRKDVTRQGLHWITVSHVSRQWRDTAIHEPSLWTNPPLSNPLWTSVMLERSRMALLPQVTLDFANDHPESITRIIEHLPRIQNFIVLIAKPPLLRYLFSNLPHSSPELTELRINHYWGDLSREATWLTSSSPTDELALLPRDLFAGCHKLRLLHLSGIRMDWNSCLFSRSLEDLTLTHIPIGSRPSRTEFEAMLSAAVNLKALTLFDACPLDTSIGASPRIRAISLQSLERLLIYSTLPEMIYFLETFGTPAIKGASVVVTSEGRAAQSIDYLFSLLRTSHLSRLIGSDSDIRTLELNNDLPGSLSIGASTLDDSNKRLPPRSRQAGTPLNMIIGLRGTTIWEALSTVCQHFYAAGLSELDLSSLQNIAPETLLSVFGTIPRLRVITTSGRSLIETISQNNHQQVLRPSTAGPIPFADLRHICFAYTVFGKRNVGGQLSVRSLRRCLEARRNLGAPIHSIELRSCEGLSQPDIHVLKKEVEHVIWDKEKHFDPNFDNYNPYSNCH